MSSIVNMKEIEVEGQSLRPDELEVGVAETPSVFKGPMRFKVFLLNDDYTPMDFVVDVLEKFFGKSKEQAVQIMLQVHNSGKGLCGLFTRDVAETKVMQVNQYARKESHPLLCSMEAESAT